jgi:hypothetical protein
MWVKAPRGLFFNTRAVLYLSRGAQVEGMPALRLRVLLFRGQCHFGRNYPCKIEITQNQQQAQSQQQSATINRLAIQVLSRTSSSRGQTYTHGDRILRAQTQGRVYS